MTGPDKKGASTGGNQVEAHQTGEEANTGIVTTAGCAICFLVAFTFLRGTEQLLLASVGGMLIGGYR
jgi:hypothetical protein